MPEPSRLVKLEQLPDIATGNKVRFLGCVHIYDANTARLTLRTHYPATDKRSATAVISIDNLLETVQRELLEVGAWLNIIGYVRPMSEAKRSNGPTQEVFVEATMMWPAGAVKLDRYEVALQELQNTSTVILQNSSS